MLTSSTDTTTSCIPSLWRHAGAWDPAAERFVAIMAEAAEAHLRLWAKEDVVGELLHTVAVAVPRGGALSYLHGYEQALRKLRAVDGMVAAENAANGEIGEKLLDDERGEEAAAAA